MTGTEIRDMIRDSESKLYPISEEIAKGIDWDGLDPVYISGKLTGLINTAKHIQGQLKHVNRK